jgi:hypothetical protein
MSDRVSLPDGQLDDVESIDNAPYAEIVAQMKSRNIVATPKELKLDTDRRPAASLVACRPALPEPSFCESEGAIDAILNVPPASGQEPIMGFPRCKLNADNLIHLASGGENTPLLHSLEAGIANGFTTNATGLGTRKSRPASSTLSREYPEVHKQKHDKELRCGHFGMISEEILAKLPAFSFTPEHIVCQNGKFRLISDKKASG